MLITTGGYETIQSYHELFFKGCFLQSFEHSHSRVEGGGGGGEEGGHQNRANANKGVGVKILVIL